MKAVMRGCQFGWSSETYDFDYKTTIRDDDGREYRVWGGRLAFFILGLFLPHEYIDYGHGYSEHLDMVNDLDDAVYGKRE